MGQIKKSSDYDFLSSRFPNDFVLEKTKNRLPNFHKELFFRITTYYSNYLPFHGLSLDYIVVAQAHA